MDTSANQNCRVTDPTQRIQIAQTCEMNEKPTTVPQLFGKITSEYANHAAAYQQNQSTGAWEKTTYAEYKQQVDKFAKIFIKLGLERHGTVAILAHNSLEWFVSEMAAIHAGGQASGIYVTNAAHSVLHILENSRASIVIIDEDHQLNKIIEIKDKIPNVKAIIQTKPQDPVRAIEGKQIYTWMDLESMDTNDVEIEYKNRLASITPNECCSIVYTSGTTGLPKGALLSHDNITWTIERAKEALPCMKYGCEVSVSYLPLAHVAGQCTDIFLALSIAATVYFADKDALKGTLVNTLKVARPTLFPGVPRVYEKFQEKMMSMGAKASISKRLIAKWAKRVTLNHHIRCMNGEPGFSIQYQLAKTLILGKVKEAIGFDRIKLLVVGAAPVDMETKKYFYSLDMPLTDLYGMTECTLVHCLSRPDYHDMTSIGKPMEGCQVKISNPDETGQGEICIKGRNIFMGYNNDKEKTSEAFDEDGWFKTGDLGHQDENGYIYISGRIKELVITAGGENIPPVHVEQLVKNECPAISNTFLVGDRRKYLTMLISLKTEIDVDGNPLDELTADAIKFVESLGLSYKKLSEILSGPDPIVFNAVKEAIERANKNAISNAQKVQKFAFLPHDFSLPTGELGPTMKLKRHFVLIKYKDLIDKLYA